MTMAPDLWPPNPETVSQDFNARHGAGLPGTFMWATERRQNHDARVDRRAECLSYVGPAPPETDDDPPPF